MKTIQRLLLLCIAVPVCALSAFGQCTGCTTISGTLNNANGTGWAGTIIIDATMAFTTVGGVSVASGPITVTVPNDSSSPSDGHYSFQLEPNVGSFPPSYYTVVYVPVSGATPIPRQPWLVPVLGSGSTTIQAIVGSFPVSSVLGVGVTQLNPFGFQGGECIGLVGNTFGPIACSSTGLPDPGSNGIVKRTGAGVTGIAIASDIESALGFTPLAPANNLSELTSTASTARTNLGLGTASTQPSSAFAGATTGTTVQKANGSGGLSAAAAADIYAAISSQTANCVVAAPNGSNGNVTCRPLAAADIPSGLSYAPLTSGSSILMGNGAGGFSAAVPGTNYAAPTSGASILKGNSAGGFSTATVGDIESTIGSQAAGLFLASPAGTSGNVAPRGIQATDVPVLNQSTTGTAGGLTGYSFSGTGSKLLTGTGTYTTGNFAKADGSSNLIDSGFSSSSFDVAGAAAARAAVAACSANQFATATTISVLTCAQVAYSQLTGTPSSLPPSGSAGGGLTGSYPNPTIASVPASALPAPTGSTLGGIESLTCTGQFIRSISTLGVPSCSTVQNADLANSAVTVTAGSGLTGGGSASLGGGVSISIPSAGITNLMLANPALTVTAGAGLTGGGSVALGAATTISIPPAGVTNTMLANPSFTATAGSGLTGGGTVSLGGSVTFSIPAAGVTNAMLANSTIGVTAGAGLSGGGTPALGGSTTLNSVLAENPQTGATYTIVAADQSKQITFTNATTVAVTLPQATGSFAAPWATHVLNIGSTPVVITPTTSTIGGASSLVVYPQQGGWIKANGAGNYDFENGGGSLALNILGAGQGAAGLYPTLATLSQLGNMIIPGSLSVLNGIVTTSITTVPACSGCANSTAMMGGTVPPGTSVIGGLSFYPNTVGSYMWMNGNNNGPMPVTVGPSTATTAGYVATYADTTGAFLGQLAPTITLNGTAYSLGGTYSALTSPLIAGNISPSAAGVNLGTTTTPFQYVNFYGTGTYGTGDMRLVGAPTALRQVTFPDASDTVAELGQANIFTASNSFTTVNLKHIVGAATTGQSCAVGVAAGTGGSPACAFVSGGSDTSFYFTVTTGTGSFTTGTLATITLSPGFPSAPGCTKPEAADGTTNGLSLGQIPYTSKAATTSTSLVFAIGTALSAASTTYTFFVNCTT